MNSDSFPKISVVTPSYNQGLFIERTIKSVIEQNYPNLEYIVIDGGSSDGTLEIIKKYENKLASWISEKDNGQSDAINKGFQIATGDIFCWLNSDDLFIEDTLRFVADFFMNNPDIDCLYGNTINIDQNDNHLMARHELRFEKNIMLYALNFIQQPSTFWRRAVYEKIGGLRNELHYTMDHEYWLRMYKNGVRFKYVEKFLSFYRWHEESKGILNSNLIKQERAALRKEYSNFPSFYALEEKIYILLKSYYRIKRQLIKIIKYRHIEIFPAHFYIWYLKNVKRQFTNIKT
jgi:glycosyltransferase involved in cell wall biosynthesis